MTAHLKRTWIWLLVATLGVTASGALLVRGFLRHVFVECHGALEALDAVELGRRTPDELERVENTDLEIRWDEARAARGTEIAAARGIGARTYENVRVEWVRRDGTCACSAIAIPWFPPTEVPSRFTLHRDTVTGLFVVSSPPRSLRDHGTMLVFRKSDRSGHRFERGRLLDPDGISMLIFVLSLIGLALGAGAALRAAPYVRRMHGWHRATLRPDGIVESETGATLGRVAPMTKLPVGHVIVDPNATSASARDVYRALPTLTRREVGVGTHERWTVGTMRRLRDARTLAVIATLTTFVALVARSL